MRKKKKFPRIAPILVILASAILFPYNFSKADDSEDANEYITWHKDDDLNFTEPIYIDPWVTLTIEKGAEVKLGNGAYIFVNGGRIIAEGTEDDPIKITSTSSESYSLIEFHPNDWNGIPDADPSSMRYVEFFNGGHEALDPPCPGCSVFMRYFFPKALASSDGSPAFSFQGGKAHMENCSFYDNKYADIEVEYFKNDEKSASYYLEVVNSNFSGNSGLIAVKSDITCQNIGLECLMNGVLLKNNWYGHWQGPTEENSPFILGEKILGDYTLEGYRNNDLISDPVIIIPGIMGSAEVNKTWKIDPITHSYDDLISSFQKSGFKKGDNLFEFPYDWRSDNTATSEILKDRIQNIIDETEVSKVDVVAHSMGGLVARKHIERDDYQDNIDQFITLGTPHKGSPKAYLFWEAAEFGMKKSDLMMKHHFAMEAKHAGYDDLYKYIQAEIPSVKELLPDYAYLKDALSGEMIEYGDNYPRNLFLEDLNNSENTEKLNKVRLTNIIGDLDNDESTISEIKIVDSVEGEKWEHGMPEGFYAESGDRGLKMGEGDETVPRYSAKSIPNNSEEIDSTHTNIPTEAQCKILNKLAPGANCHYTDETNIPNILLINIFSPVDIQIIAPDNKRVGKDFNTGKIVNEIEGAYYSGFDTENEFLTIPNPLDGEYKVLTQGTGEGEYKVEITKIKENPETLEASELTGMIEGMATPDRQDEKSVKIEENEVIIGEKDSTPPEISISSPQENRVYSNSDIISLDYQVQDDISEPEKISKEAYFDSDILVGSKIDLSLHNLGEHRLKLIAKDEADNRGEKEIIFKTETDLDSIIKNVNHYFSLKLIKNKNDRTVLISRLKLVGEVQEFMETIENSRFLKSKAKKALIEALEEQISRQLDWLVNYVEKNSNPKMKNSIDSKTGELLMESLEAVKYY